MTTGRQSVTTHVRARTSVLAVVAVESPVGRITAAVRGHALVAMAVGDHWPRLARRLASEALVPGPDAAGLAGRLGRYFAGDVDALDELAVAPAGTGFQRAVWAALRRIPAGETRSYRDVARVIGAPSAVRAVGAANGANPIWLVIPCHRVIGADGSLTGYGGGLALKRRLLDHERRARGFTLTGGGDERR
jgi:methylated-DNA-[protein]-cysteine S-methyltransferase